MTTVLDIQHNTGTDNKQAHDTRDRDVHCLIITGLNQGARLLIALVARSRIALVRPSGTGAAIAATRGARLVGIRLIRIGLIRIGLVGVGSNGIRGARAQAQHRGTEFALGAVHSLNRGVLVCSNILGILQGDLELLPSLRSVRILVEALGLLDQSGKTIEVKAVGAQSGTKTAPIKVPATGTGDQSASAAPTTAQTGASIAPYAVAVVLLVAAGIALFAVRKNTTRR